MRSDWGRCWSCSSLEPWAAAPSPGLCGTRCPPDLKANGYVSLTEQDKPPWPGAGQTLGGKSFPGALGRRQGWASEPETRGGWEGVVEGQHDLLTPSLSFLSRSGKGVQRPPGRAGKAVAHHDIIIVIIIRDSGPARPCSKQSAFGDLVPVAQGAAYPTATTLPRSTRCPQGSFGILADSSRRSIDIRFDLSNHKDVLSFPAEYSPDALWVDYIVYTAAANMELAKEKRVCVLAGARRWWDEKGELLPAPGFPPGMPKRMRHVKGEGQGRWQEECQGMVWRGGEGAAAKAGAAARPSSGRPLSASSGGSSWLPEFPVPQLISAFCFERT